MEERKTKGRQKKVHNQETRMKKVKVNKESVRHKDGTIKESGPSSVVGIAIAYGLHGPGIESRWGRDFPHLSRPVLRPTQSPAQWVPSLSRG
jgi:hypothetical protein